ncbi:hypothetical protein [Marisediminicola sp. LYQ85]|uniref:phage major capsid protein n=1 Tax=Marisediminicola sp. LYQ85 TaxID=3391062 RepID=UPI003983380A
MTEFMNGGDFSVDLDTRTVRGLLLPWDEQTQSNHSFAVSFGRGDCEVPTDISVLNANRRHNRYDPVARFMSVDDTERGLVASFAISRNPEGDQLLDQIKSGELKKLSPEIGRLSRDGVKGKGKLTGAAFVDEGAFATAGLFALDPIEPHEEEVVTESSSTYVDPEDGTKTTDKSTTTEEVEDLGDGTKRITRTTTYITEITDPENPEPTESEAIVPIPNTLDASSTATPTLDKDGLFALITNARKSGGRDQESLKALADIQGEGLFALNDVKISGANQLGTGVVQPAWLGQLWSGKRYARKVIPLLSNGPLTALEVKGYRWGVKPEVSTWAGNKADVPTNTPTTTAYSVGIQRFAGGWDIAREFIDFNQTEVLNEFFAHMVDSYAKKSDDYVLTQLLAAATPVAATTYPTDVNAAMGKIVQGALQVIANDATPSFALVAPDVYSQLLFTLDKNRLAFLNGALGLEEGSIESFKVVPHSGLAAGRVVVADKQSATSLELAGSPIRVNALDIARGGVDEAIFGYVALKVDYPEGIAVIQNAA